MKLLCLLKFLFIKVQVSSIFKEKKIQESTSRIRSRNIDSAMHHFNPYTTEDLLTMSGLIWIFIATTLTLTNPYFVYESLICQRQFGGWK